MEQIVAAIVPVFLIVGLGFFATRLGLFQRENAPVFTGYVVKVGLPVLIFVSVAGRRDIDFGSVTYLVVYAAAGLIMIALGRLYGRLVGASKTRSTVVAYGSSGTNNGFIGFPILLLIMPNTAGLAVGLDMVVDNLITIPLLIAMLESAASTQKSLWARVRETVLRVVKHPLVIAIVLAVIVNVTGVKFPAIVDRSLTMIANSAAPVILFAIGMMLVGMDLAGQLRDIVVTVFGKLIAMPAVGVTLLLAAAAAGMPGMTFELRAALVITCALPSMSMMPAIVAPYGEGQMGAAAMMLSTVLSFFTLTGWMFLLHTVGWL